ncbi:MAG TPA: translation initiation factor IF-2 [bacterium]|nr:translation initiation factor IF-2 [bacterium]
MTRHDPEDPGKALSPAKESGAKSEKVRIYQIAKEYSVSSEAMLKIVRGLGVEAKSHMSSIDAETVQKVEQEFNKEKQAVKEDFARKRAVDRASRKRAQEAKAKPADAPAAKPEGKRESAPAQGGSAPSRPRGGGGGGRRPVDQKVVRANIKRIMSDDKGRRRYRKRKTEAATVEDEERVLRVTEFISTSELASYLDLSASQIIAKAMELGSMVTINQRLDRDMIEMLADEFDWTVEFESVMEVGTTEEEEEVREEDLEPRSPVVTIMGHVDHGKTSLLDHIRESNVIAGESGGITQHIGAYHVELPRGIITFLDTPGHEAFTAMRARGAQITDIVILVVAADDSVMPQTIEAIDHAKDAEVPIIVAINKIDRPGSNPDQVRQQLTGYGITPEEWGGEHMVVDVSAKTGQGVPELLEAVLLQAEVMELKSARNRPARGVIIESRKERGRGTVVTALVQEGELKVGDALVAGSESGRVRALTNERGHRIQGAGPSTPCGVLGFSDVPRAGEVFRVMKNEREAREVASRRAQLLREQEHRYHRHTTLENLFDQIQGGETAELRVVIKADVEGSAEAVADSLQKMATREVEMRVVHRGVGTINESDVLLAAASDAIVLGFHVNVDSGAQQTVKREGVDVRMYEVIYEMVEDVRAAMEGLLKPDIERRTIGTAEVRATFRVPKLGTIAGSMVVSGQIKRNAGVLVRRNGEVIHEGRVASLRRFKDDVPEVKNGFECGIGVENFPTIQEGDVLEVFEDVEVARRL